MPNNSFIDAGLFGTPQQLAAYLHHLLRSPHEYERYFDWKATASSAFPLGGETETRRLPQGFYRARQLDWTDLQCRICHTVHHRKRELDAAPKKAKARGQAG